MRTREDVLKILEAIEEPGDFSTGVQLSLIIGLLLDIRDLLTSSN